MTEFYVAVVLGGVLLTSPEPATQEQCDFIKRKHPETTLCIEKEPDCGGAGNPKCLGRADEPPVKRTTTRRRR